MAESELLSIIRRMEEALVNQDVSALKDHIFSADVEWRVPGRHPLSGNKTGCDKIVAFRRLLNKAGVRSETLAVNAIDQETVVQLQRLTARTSTTTLDSMELWIYSIANGRIARIESYIGDQHPVDLFYWSACRLKPVPDRLLE